MDTTTSAPIPDQIASSGSSSRQDGPQGPVPAPCPQGGIPRPAPQPPQVAGESREASRTLSATYDPADNKLRLRSLHRLDKETYATVRAAGFIFAPKQDLFVAPAWTPEREDLLLEMCGEIGDEDTSLVDRAEGRAERFEGYSDRREAEAEAARQAVAAITDNIPLGQPILVGHHSEKRARRDADRIENGMRKAVRLWETSKYWTDRAAGALRHAKYKELPGVRARRIKTIEADKRKQERDVSRFAPFLRLWEKLQDPNSLRKQSGQPSTFEERVKHLADVDGCYQLAGELRDGKVTAEEAQARRIKGLKLMIARSERWIAHYENRLAYERAMLAEGGGLAGAGHDYQPGGQVLRRGKWFFVKRVNRQGGAVSSLSVLGHFASTITLDEVQGYRPPAEGVAQKIKAATDKGPMCNYPGEGFRHMTTDEWKRKKMSDVPQSLAHKPTEAHGQHRTRATWGGNWTTVAVFLTDAKRVDPPAAGAAAAPTVTPADLPPAPAAPPPERKPREKDPREGKFSQMGEQLRMGVEVVSAPQLFPTPMPLAERMAGLAQLRTGDRVLEPSAGTGNIVRAIIHQAEQGGISLGAITAVEINGQLAARLGAAAGVTVIPATSSRRPRRTWAGDSIESS